MEGVRQHTAITYTRHTYLRRAPSYNILKEEQAMKQIRAGERAQAARASTAAASSKIIDMSQVVQ